MGSPKKKINATTRYLITLGAILLAANILLGVVLVQQSISTVQSMVRKSMLSVVTTASSLIDGDALGALTEEDIGSSAYNQIYDNLTAFQKNVDIEYIYAVRQAGEDEYVFTVDPDPEDPADFGEEVLVTDALRSAATGTAAVDSEAAEDEWGNFYSAYSPVYDSEGRIAGVIGVDFDAEWFKNQMMEHSWSIVVVSLISVAIACVIVLFVAGRMRKQYRQLNNALSVFSSDMDELKNEIESRFVMAGTQPEPVEPEEAEEIQPAAHDTDAEIEELRQKMNSMHKEIRQYLKYMDKMAHTDAMTYVGNTTAYGKLFRKMDKKIEEGTAAFHVAVFDINNLKPVNDEYGHTYGDRIIKAAAGIIAHVFGYENTFRIGGDEFLAISENTSDDIMTADFAHIEEEIEAYNKSHTASKGVLSISKGFSGYRPGEDEAFKQVFNRADKEMYANKEAYHRLMSLR